MDWDAEMGGGFINDSIAVDEPQQLASSVSVGGDDKTKSIAAVSVSQIAKLTRPNEGLVIHNKKIYHVNLVAYVHDIIDINPQKIHLSVADYTSGGPLEVSHIIGDTGTPDQDANYSMFNDDVQCIQENTDQPRNLQSVRTGDYVRCIGVVKFNQDRANLVAYNMRIVDDPNEVTMHILEVIRDSMYYERLQSSNGPLRVQKSDNYNSNSNFQARRDEFGNLSTRDKHLLKFLKERSDGDKGIKLEDIVSNFKAFSRVDIIDSLNTLSTEGQCWQGDNEDTWCVNTSN